MKRIMLILLLTIASTASASLRCGIEPIAPIDCSMLCMCDSKGRNCNWIPVCN